MCAKQETISAVATAPGEGSIGIIRISGKRALAIAGRIFHGKRKREKFVPRHVYYGTVCDTADGSVLDEVLLFFMNGPHSYTGEDVVEIQCHGGMKPLGSILALTLREGARLAEPGEFTKRAFLNGRLDLAQAESVIDIIRAKTDASLKMAAGHLGGAFSAKVRDFRQEILRLIAHLEAAIDFPEDDIDDVAIDEARRTVENVRGDIRRLLSTAKAGRVLRDGLETAIIGRPNVGKSSLLNALLKEDRAIVTDVPGTTRDVIEEYANVGGVLLKIIDTAGIRETKDAVEKIGVERSRIYLERADLILFLLDATAEITKEDIEILSLLRKKEAILLFNKSDIAGILDEKEKEVCRMAPEKRVLSISAKTGAGIGALGDMIHAMVYEGVLQQGEEAFVSSVRQADLLAQAASALDEAFDTIARAMPPDFIVIDLRTALERLGEITGEAAGEDVIEQIFSQFCIGK